MPPLEAWKHRLRSWQRIATRDAEYTRDTAVLLKVPRCVLLRHHAVLDVWLRRHRAPLPAHCILWDSALLWASTRLGPSAHRIGRGRADGSRSLRPEPQGPTVPLRRSSARQQLGSVGRPAVVVRRQSVVRTLTASAADRGQHVREGRHVRVLAGRVGRHSGGARVVCCPHAGKRTRLRSCAPIRSHLPLWHASCVQCSGRMLRLGRSAWLLMRAVAVRFQPVLGCTHVHVRALVRALPCACVFAHGTALVARRS